MRRFSFTALILAFGLAGPLAAGPTPAEFEPLAEDWRSTSGPGFAIGILQDGEVLWSAGFGQANLEHGVPIDADTVFDIASVSKQFAGMAIAMLILDGKLTVDDDIRNHLPEVPDFGYMVTVGHLLHHISGIRDWVGLMMMSGLSMEDSLTFEQIMRMVSYQEAVSFEPGTAGAYSNTGYNLLSRLVEVVSGESFSDWTRQNIFQPLGMNDTYFPSRNGIVTPGRADSYRKGADGEWLRVANRLTALGSSSLHTTVNDLLKWLHNFETHQVGGIEAYEMMQQPAVLADGSEQPYGFGLAVSPWQDRPLLSHGGSWAGFRTWLGYFPESRTGVVVLGNHAEFASRETAMTALGALWGIEQPSDQPAADEPVESIEVPPQTLEELAGFYRVEAVGVVVSIRHENGALVMQILEPVALDAVATDRFVGPDGTEIQFLRDDSGAVAGAKAKIFGDEFDARRVGGDIDPAGAAALAGDYYSPELDTTYTVVSRGAELFATHRRHDDLQLFQVEGDHFVSTAWYMTDIEFDRDENGNVIGWRASAPRNKNIRFVKR